MEGGLRSCLPREHGAWVMLGLSLGCGWTLRGHLDPAGILLTLGWVLLFLGQEGLARRGPARSTLLVSGSGAVLLGSGALPGDTTTRLALLLTILTGSVALLLRARSRTTGRVPLFAWGVHLAAAVAMAAPVALLGTAADPTKAHFAAALTALNFGAGVLAVRARRDPEAGSRVLALWSLAGCLQGLLLAPSAWPGLLVFPVRLLQLRLQPSLSWKAVGWSETAFGLWVAVWLCV